MSEPVFSPKWRADFDAALRRLRSVGRIGPMAMQGPEVVQFLTDMRDVIVGLTDARDHDLQQIANTFKRGQP